MHIKVWDLPLRLFHWLLVVAIAGALVTVNLGDGWMRWHQRFGLAVVGLMTFRLVWGFCGSTHARFASFFPIPVRLIRHWRGQWHQPGHTPIGALSVLAMLSLFSFQALTGLFATDDVSFSGPWAGEVASSISRTLSGWHRATEELVYALVGVHLLAIAVHRLRGKRLIGAMLHGCKEADQRASRPEPASHSALAIALVLAVLAVGLAGRFWSGF